MPPNRRILLAAFALLALLGAGHCRAADGSEPAVRASQRRLAELEAEQRALLTQSTPAVTPTPRRGNAQEIARQEAVVARLLKESAARPRTGFATPNSDDPRLRAYLDDWTAHTQHYGNQHFPRAAGKSLYGSVQVHVTLDAQGRLLRSAISRGDPDPRLNAAVMRMLHRAAPFPRFPAALAADYDALEIVRTLSFTHEHDPKP
ncbi:MAG: hypothetical protein RJA63_1200 [Pseudomonadota bacterium]|jgi:protein TonB